MSKFFLMGNFTEKAFAGFLKDLESFQPEFYYTLSLEWTCLWFLFGYACDFYRGWSWLLVELLDLAVQVCF